MAATVSFPPFLHHTYFSTLRFIYTLIPSDICTGSVMSLAMGLLFGGLAGYGAMQTSVNPKSVMVGLCKSKCYKISWWRYAISMSKNSQSERYYVLYMHKNRSGCSRLMKTELNNVVLHPTNKVVVKLQQLFRPQQVAYQLWFDKCDVFYLNRCIRHPGIGHGGADSQVRKI